VKKSKMDRLAIKDFMYGGLMELIRNRKYYYHSAVGAGYSHLTDEGKTALAEYMNMVSWKMLEAEEIDLNNRAKEQTLNALKGESK
jgi:hypothetical protein